VYIRGVRIALATSNAGKRAELQELLGDVAELVAVGVRVDETGTTFEENARLKAEAALRETGLPGLGDDSGLEVAALDGRPGVLSARFAGEGASDAANIAKLLDELRGERTRRRGARFRCVLALAWPGEPLRTFEGVCRGRILEAPRGTGGFGYDPVFELLESRRTFAELSGEEKNRVSHRGRAVALLRAWLVARLAKSVGGG
jgi:XTP/dITP diphosphohydrolase